MMVTGIAILILLAGRNAIRALQNSQMADPPFECPAEWGKFPVPDDCSSFYNCVSSNARKKKCPDGQYFDKFFKKCDKQDEVDCNTEVTAPRIITFKCPFSWGKYPYPEDCSKHYHCLFGKPSIKKCEKKMLFDANEKNCEDEEKVDCGSRFNPYAISSFCQKPNGQFVKRGSYCKNYVDCKNGIAIEKVCPTGELFDEELGKCEWSEIANCNEKDPLCPTSNGISMVRGTQCKSYVVCKKGKASIHVCPADRLFNKEIKNCDWPELVDCNEEEITVTDRITTILFRSTSDFHTKATPEQPLTISSKQITGPAPRQTSTISTIEVTEPTPQQPSTVPSTEPTPQQPSTVPSTEPTPQQPSTVPSTEPAPQQPSTVPSTEPTLQQQSTVPTLKITKPTPPQPSTVSSTTIFKQPSTISSKKITTLAPTSITSTLQSIAKSSQLTSLTTSEQLTTPIKTSVAVTTFHSILPTMSLRVTTPIHTSPSFPEKSTISPLISSTIFNRTSTPINTSFSKSWTNPQEISTSFSTTPNNIPLSHSTSHKSLSTSQTPSEATIISIPKTSSTVPEPITDSSFLTTPRGCTFGDEMCEPDEALCPGEFGEFPHPDTPFYFVHCDHWRPYIKKCPHELHFNPELKVCSWAK